MIRCWACKIYRIVIQRHQMARKTAMTPIKKSSNGATLRRCCSCNKMFWKLQRFWRRYDRDILVIILVCLGWTPNRRLNWPKVYFENLWFMKASHSALGFALINLMVNFWRIMEVSLNWWISSTPAVTPTQNALSRFWRKWRSSSFFNRTMPNVDWL